MPVRPRRWPTSPHRRHQRSVPAVWPGSRARDSCAELADAFRVRSMADGRIVAAVAMVEQAGTFRDDGATSVEAWLAERFGLSAATARSYCHVAEKARPLPHLVGSLCAGEISFDKVRAVVDVATPRSDQSLCAQAKALGVRELAEVARTTAARARAASVSPSRSAARRPLPAFQRWAPHGVDAAAPRGLCPDQGLCRRLGQGSLAQETRPADSGSPLTSPALPHLVGSLCAGEISFDKVRAVVDVATPRTDQALVRPGQGARCA